MVSLLETYRGEGFEPAVNELPDHLPILLEFLSTRTNAEAKEMLADAAHILEALKERLEKRRSDFGSVFAALLNIANSRADSAAVADLLRRPDDDPDNPGIPGRRLGGIRSDVRPRSQRRMPASPRHAGPHGSALGQPASGHNEIAEARHAQLPVRNLSLHRARRNDRGIDRALRARPLHLEDVIFAVAAAKAGSSWDRCCSISACSSCFSAIWWGC